MRFLSSLLPVSLLAYGVVVAGSQCKCAPSDPCWPSGADWSALNETVSGRLIKTIPPGSVCYKSEPNYNPSACQYLLKNWSNPEYHSSNPVTVSDPLWSNNTCTPIYPNGTSVSGDPNARAKGCSLGYLSPYVVNATTAQHVQATLQFAKDHNLRLNIKNTGHNPEKSSAAGSLSIWTHHMKQFKIHQSFQPSNCSSANSHMAATVGAGIQDGELLDQLAKRNLTAVAGTSMDVGVAGWATGGGHGVLTGAYGMGADNVMEATVVTPNGDLVTADECQNKDLFWAIRGGGGGTFGVILSLTVNTYPMPSLSTATVSMTARNGTSAKTWWRVIAGIHKEMVKLQDAGVMGYYTAGVSPYGFQYTMFQPNTSNTTSIDHLISPLIIHVQKHNDSVDSSSFSSWLPVWYAIEKSMPPGGHAGLNYGARATRLIPRKAIEDTDSLAETLEIIGDRNEAFADGVSNPSLSGTMTISHRPVDSSLNPAWRDATVHLISGVKWNDRLPISAAEKAIAQVTNTTGYAMRQLAPDSGVYYNEANPWEPDWQWAFWGPNYPRILSIKQKYDPDNLLWCHHCVGSESFVQQNNGSLCPVF
ncbi:hypothetical protein N7489_001182 [Penicillium chrysogenum]|uniref:FAD-binding PCMH-type domain-containing protein n=1 Tax=Penicillium chrysogenum TaxID=5076 RepID=A0ABQ8WJ90_PENCH|nr:uncharacterized protein N7489_001182 [Penicillium chrysogenum]KAJ5250772.1 hypothetical protein N7489_001182 [Penicillium chrysogenum]KAJ5269670.1 hypothetical protein N7505_005428 [Penicillium chrysogenum]KAJ6147599.1 hypothetical protein N7497_009581 [Penicillium chrysogenum]